MSQTDAAAHAFRKAASPVTEENMKPDMGLVTAMNKAGIRVQDLVVYISRDHLSRTLLNHEVKVFCESYEVNRHG